MNTLADKARHELSRKLFDLLDPLPQAWEEDRSYSDREIARLAADQETVRQAAHALTLSSVAHISEGRLCEALRPAVSQIFDHFDELSRGQALQILVDAMRDLDAPASPFDAPRPEVARSDTPLTDAVQNDLPGGTAAPCHESVVWWSNRYQAMLDHARQMERDANNAMNALADERTRVQYLAGAMDTVAPSAIREQEPVAWRREWDGDVSDVGMWVYVEDKAELDEPLNRWQALYAEPQPAPPPMTKEEKAAADKRFMDEIRDALAAPSSVARSEELERANVGLADEAARMRGVLSELVEAGDGLDGFDEMPYEQGEAAMKRWEAAQVAARPFTEGALTLSASTRS